MTEIREQLLSVVRTGDPVALTAEQSREVVALIYEVGRHEAAAISIAREREAFTARDKAAADDIAGLRSLLARERRSVWDSFAAASIAAGNAVEIAAATADQMLIRREGRRA